METGFCNPLRKGLGLNRAAEPCAVVIFGASGDLTKRKLIPALHNLARKNLLAAGFSVIGAARTVMTHDQFRTAMREATLQFTQSVVHDVTWQSFEKGLFYNPIAIHSLDSFVSLRKLLDYTDAERGSAGNRLFYLATPPAMFEPIIEKLAATGLNNSQTGSWTRIIVEKTVWS